jgi:hypothetical protein
VMWLVASQHNARESRRLIQRFPKSRVMSTFFFHQGRH